MRIGIIGSGSWATAIAKILTCNGNRIHWWIRNEAAAATLQERHHNPHYLSSIYFEPSTVAIYTNINLMLQQVDVVVLAIPSAYIKEVLQQINIEHLHNKKVISAIKGLLPEQNILLHEYLQNAFNMPLQNYFALMGPCHAEEVAAEKLSYLTIAGINEEATAELAKKFETNSIKVATSNDLVGVQYAAVLKNIYALGAGIAHGLDYGDNFLSVFIANSANEMVGFLKHHKNGSSTNDSPINYAASVYLGDLLVTCYSLHSRNRTFGNMIGKGYSVKAAQLEMNMVAEGYNASKCFYTLNKTVGASMPIAETIYNILHMGLHPKLGLINIQHLLH